ncbi:MAG TPA: hypothetical protein VIW80_22895 [Pyrinomonadaceae bacterium]
MWLEPAPAPVLEEKLFRFLLTVRDERPQASTALIAEEATLREICSATHPHLSQAFNHCIIALLIEMDADVDALNAPAQVFGLALAINNCIAPARWEQLGTNEDEAPLYDEFTEALIDALPVARTKNAALAYHAVLRGTSNAAARISAERASFIHALIERSPLTALWSLDVHTPSALEALAAELLPGWKMKQNSAAYGWRNDGAWLKTVAMLLRDERIARWVRRRWLSMPETRQACRNTGLLLEALRRRGDSRAFILDFYEAYDYFRARTRAERRRGQKRFWPILEEIEKLLRASGEHDAAIEINRRGNEYFLKFHPLVETVIAENGVPADYAHLSREFIQSLRPLLAFVTESTRQRLSFGAVTFSDAGS